MRKLQFILLGCVAGAIACDDSNKNKGGADAIVIPQRDMGLPDAEIKEDPDAAPELEPDMPEPPPPEMEVRHLVIVGAERLSVFQDSPLDLTVRYEDDAGQALQGEISVRLLDGMDVDRTAEGIGGSRIADTEETSGADGRATFRLDAGNRNALFIVQANAELAEPVEWVVTVSNRPKGGVAIRVTYDEETGRYAAADMSEVRVILSRLACDALESLPVAQIQAAAALPPIRPFDGDDETRTDALDHGAVFSAVAWGVGANEAAVARGCTEEVAVAGGAEAVATIVLQDGPLEFKGVYEVEHHLDMTDLIDNEENLGQLGEILDILGAIGGGAGQPPYPRGDGIVLLACDRGNLDAALCTLLRAVAAPIIEDFFADVLPPELLDVLDVFGDIYRILAELTVLGEIEIAQAIPDEDGMLIGNESRWQAFRFAWRQGCPFDLPDQCLRTFDLVDAGIGPRTLVGVFDAQLMEGDVLAIQPHQLGVHFGRLAVALLETWLLPGMLGEDGPITFEEYIARIVPCADINAALPPNDPASGLCEANIVAPLAEQLVAQIEGIGGGFDAFTFEGTVRVADVAVPDLLVDRLLEGSWDAAFGEDAMLVEDAGDFEGCRAGQCDADLEAEGEAPDAP